MKIFMFHLPHFYYSFPICPIYIFSLKSKLKHTGIDITKIFSRYKIFKHKTHTMRRTLVQEGGFNLKSD